MAVLAAGRDPTRRGRRVLQAGERYEAEVKTGALFVGSPETIARKIATMARDLHLNRFDLKYDVMNLPRESRTARSSYWAAKWLRE